jgi:hypothetical protein
MEGWMESTIPFKGMFPMALHKPHFPKVPPSPNSYTLGIKSLTYEPLGYTLHIQVVAYENEFGTVGTGKSIP